MLIGTTVLLALVASRAVLSLHCDNPQGCGDGFYNRGGHRDLREDLRNTRSEFHSKPVDRARDEPLNSKYESLIKSINEMHRVLEQNNNRVRTQDKILERFAERLPDSPVENAECSSWALQSVAALMRASRSGNSKSIASVVSAGIPVDAVDENGGGRTALHWAVTRGKLAAATQLLELGAYVNKPAPGVANNTPLHIAASMGDLQMVQMLVENGADIQARNGQCLTPREVSNLHSHQEVTNWLQENAERYTRCKDIRVPAKLLPYKSMFTPASSTAVPLTTMSTPRAMNSTMRAITLRPE